MKERLDLTRDALGSERAEALWRSGFEISLDEARAYLHQQMDYDRPTEWGS